MFKRLFAKKIVADSQLLPWNSYRRTDPLVVGRSII